MVRRQRRAATRLARRLRTSTRTQVGQKQGKTLAKAEGNEGVGGLHRSLEVGEREAPGPGEAKAVGVDVN